MVICLERGADLHTAQLMPLPLTVSCSSKIQIGFTFMVPAHLGSPGKRAVKWVCVCVWDVKPQLNQSISQSVSDCRCSGTTVSCVTSSTVAARPAAGCRTSTVRARPPSRTSAWSSHVTRGGHVVQSRDGNLYYDVIDHIPRNTELLVIQSQLDVCALYVIDVKKRFYVFKKIWSRFLSVLTFFFQMFFFIF